MDMLNISSGRGSGSVPCRGHMPYIKSKAPAISPLNYGTNTKILTKITKPET